MQARIETHWWLRGYRGDKGRVKEVVFERVTTLKLFGVHVLDNLMWSHHAQTISATLFKIIGTCWIWNRRPHEPKFKLWRGTDSNKVGAERRDFSL